MERGYGMPSLLKRPSFDLDRLHNSRLRRWHVALVAREVDDFVDDIHTLNDLTEDGVLVVEGRGIGDADEELAACRVGVLASGHAENAARVVRGAELSGDRVARSARSRHSGCARLGVGVAALDHEPGDDSVEGGLIVKALGSKLLKVLDVTGSELRKELEDDAAQIGFEDSNLFSLLGSSCARSTGFERLPERKGRKGKEGEKAEAQLCEFHRFLSEFNSVWIVASVPKSLDRHRFDDRRVGRKRIISVVTRKGDDLVHHVETFDDFAVHGVLTIQVWGSGHHQEELRACGIWIG